MASAKFLEEALSTDVDESALNSIVGSLETQLVTASPGVGAQVNAATAVNLNHVNSAISNGGTTVPSSSTQKHGVANGGAGESVNILLSNSDPAKSSLAPTISHQPVSTNVVNTVVGAVPASGYINQMQTTSSGSSPSIVSAGATTHQPNLNTTLTNKHHEPVKILYPNNNQTLTTSAGVVNINNSRVTFPAGSLPNGNINLVNVTSGTTSTLQSHHQQHPTILNAVTSSVQSVVSQSIIGGSNVNAINKQTSVIGNNSGNVMDAGNIKQSQLTHQQQGPALVLKTNNPTGVVVTTSQQHIQGQQMTGMVSVPMTTMAALTGVTHAGMPGVAKNMAAGQTQMVGTHPSGATTLLSGNVQILNMNAVRQVGPGGPGQKMHQRVVIQAPHMVGGRPGQPGHITLQALQALQTGTSGHLLVKTENGQYQLIRVGNVGTAPTTPAAAAITPTGSPATTTAGMPTTTYRLQSVSTPGVPRPPTPMQQHTVVPAGATTTVVQAMTAQSGVAVTAQAAVQAQLQRQAVDSTKEKCRKFLANLLELSSREPKQVEKNVRTLIQELIDTKVEPEEFCDRLEKLLNASPQPCLIGFLKKSLPLLRQALITKELEIDGIRPPLHTVVYSLAPGGAMVPHLQARGANMQTHIRPTGPQLGTTQMRVMGPMVGTGGGIGGLPGGVVGGLPRSPHTTIQHRLVTPARPHLNAQAKMMSQMVTNASVSTASSPNTMVMVRHQAPSITSASMPKPAITPKEAKEKKTFSSSGYTGDDDINDVAAMGGVNLAEESQRILGSTEFVGTQIRSVKDEMFLHSGPLQQKIKQIMAKHGLDEPSTSEIAAMVSHATQERLKTLVEKLAVIAEHRLDLVKSDSRYEVVQDVKAQLRFLEDLDRMERRRHEEQERELLLRAAKSRSKSEDPEQAKLKAKAKEMQRAEMEELRQREANLTALQAIGPRKKPKLDLSGSPGTSGQSSSAGPSGTSSNTNRSSMPLRPRVKRVNLRDLLFLLEQERETCRTPFLYKAYLK